MSRQKKNPAHRIAEQTFLAAQNDPVVWALRNIVLPNKRQWDMTDRRWQIKILEDQSRRINVIKGAQEGFTVTFLCKTLHYLNYHNATAMYTLPTRDNVADFVNLILDPIIQHSPHISSMIADNDSVRLKKFRTQVLGEHGEPVNIESFFHLMEGSVEPRMVPVDILANDEIDRTDPDYLNQFIARLDNSPDPHHFQFSTPTIPGYGIDRAIQNTTQNEWMVTCSKCTAEQVLDWDKNFAESPGPHYICSHCREPLRDEDIIGGQWVAMHPENNVTGYHISHMMMPISRPVAGMWQELKENRITLKNFYNLRLGKAYSSATGAFEKEMFRTRCFDLRYPKESFPLSSAQYYLGADQGNQAHIVIIKRDGGKQKIVYAEKTDDKGKVWNQRVIELIRTYHVSFAVIDALPNTHDAREILDEFRNDGDRVALCHYNEQPELVKRDRQNGKVHVSKVEMFDKLRTEFSDGAWKFWGDGFDPTIDQIIDHFTNLKRDEREDHRGITRGVWVNTGPDHYAHATLYAMVAAMMSGGSSFDFVSLGDMDDTETKDEQAKTTHEKVWGRRAFWDDSEES